MKLRPKKFINAELATERKNQIDQGIKLAEKVDAIRSTLSKEEKDLDLFRKQSVEIIKADVGPLVKEKESLIEEIENRRKELLKLREPLEVEWLKVEEERKSLFTVRYRLDEEAQFLHEKREELFKEQKLLEENKQRISEMKRNASDFLISANKVNQDAVLLLLRARGEVDEMRQTVRDLEIGLTQREAGVTNQEQGLILRRTQQDEREQDIINSERKLNDRIQTHERNIKRYERSH